MRRWQLAGAGVAVLLAGCGGVTIAPKPVLPKALVQEIPATVGLLVPADQSSYAHSETRAGVVWSVALGQGQQVVAREVLDSLFREVREFSELEVARKSEGLQAIFEPRIEQYSFATAQETGGDYVAVTIRYRVNVLAPDGVRYDSLTLTGYGTGLAEGFGSGGPMDEATRAAMRDAAAKFLTQFPELPLAKELSAGTKLVADPAEVQTRLAAALDIDVLPIRESRRSNPSWRPGAVIGNDAPPLIVPGAVSPAPAAPGSPSES
ncbi:MAG: hypothetical protein RLZZ473_1055 [Pseudomonadota bacterium]